MSAEYKDEILDNPLVVHKETDASYEANLTEVTMNSTHSEEEDGDYPTLERHRYRKKKKSKKPILIVILLIAIAFGVLTALYYTGNLIKPVSDDTTTTKKSYTTMAENKFEGTITVKGSYIFFEGKEVDGLKGLEREIKYLKEGTKFVIQDEGADFNLLTLDENDKAGGNILSLLSMYNIDYEITHIVSSGLISKYETTTQKPTEKTTETTFAKTTDSQNTTVDE